MNNKSKIIIIILMISVCMMGCSFNGSYSKSIKEMSGSSTSWTGDKNTEYEFEKGETVSFDYSSELKGGELTIQLLNPSNEVIQEFEANEEGRIDKVIDESGTYQIFIKGKDFNGSFLIEW